MAGRALSPVRRITQTARRAADGNLRERIGLTGPADEVKELADTFDVMLERLDASFEGQRQFAAHASHELRTPLATNRTVLEVALASGRVPAEMRDLVDTVLLTNARSELIIDGLLMLARSESQAITRVPVDLSDVAADAVEQTAEEAAAARITVDATPDPAGTVGDPLLLEHLALNLVRNGLRHNHPDGWVTVATATRPQSDEAELVVTNSGPVVPPEHIGALFEPFRRLGNGRDSGRDGIGLGLSIVRSVVRAHGGRVQAEPRDDGGLIVRVSLPATNLINGGLLTAGRGRGMTR
jgi:signal transduction histidine kinase